MKFTSWKKKKKKCLVTRLKSELSETRDTKINRRKKSVRVKWGSAYCASYIDFHLFNFPTGCRFEFHSQLSKPTNRQVTLGETRYILHLITIISPALLGPSTIYISFRIPIIELYYRAKIQFFCYRFKYLRERCKRYCALFSFRHSKPSETMMKLRRHTQSWISKGRVNTTVNFFRVHSLFAVKSISPISTLYTSRAHSSCSIGSIKPTSIPYILSQTPRP